MLIIHYIAPSSLQNAAKNPENAKHCCFFNSEDQITSWTWIITMSVSLGISLRIGDSYQIRIMKDSTHYGGLENAMTYSRRSKFCKWGESYSRFIKQDYLVSFIFCIKFMFRIEFSQTL